MWGGGGECTCINICTSICMTVHISECTALMSPNRAKQPYMHEKWILVDLQLLPTLGFGIAHDRVQCDCLTLNTCHEKLMSI